MGGFFITVMWDCGIVSFLLLFLRVTHFKSMIIY